jgi:hypothetical protein
MRRRRPIVSSTQGHVPLFVRPEGRTPRRCVQEMFARFKSRGEVETIPLVETSPADAESHFQPSPTAANDAITIIDSATQDSTYKPTLSGLRSPDIGDAQSNSFPNRPEATRPVSPDSATRNGVVYPYPQRIPDDLSHPAAQAELRNRMRFALGVASCHPDALSITTRDVNADLSTQRSFVKRIRDRCTTGVSWCKEKSQAFGRSKSAVSLGLDSESGNGSTKIFGGASLSNVGHLFRKIWAESWKHGPSLLSSRVTAT